MRLSATTPQSCVSRMEGSWSHLGEILFQLRSTAPAASENSVHTVTHVGHDIPAALHRPPPTAALYWPHLTCFYISLLLTKIIFNIQDCITGFDPDKKISLPKNLGLEGTVSPHLTREPLFINLTLWEDDSVFS